MPWRERAREVLRQLREWARDREGPALEAFLESTFGQQEEEPSLADLQLAFDDFVCARGSAGDDRSLLKVFADESEDLTADEREQLPTWETARKRTVYLLDRAHRDRLELWDPIAAGRQVLQLLEKMPPARAAALTRGTVVITTTAPWGTRRIALGEVEMYDDDEAVELYRHEVRDGGKTWNDLPPAAPII